ncbi:molecular chaperone DnaK [Spirulina major CS-329]|uniref:molecular chaperone DnaK n=1 Tax=Spirulina TaxID=1154 RepID=UPI00232B7D26|nr:MULTISPECIES: molecular chaperone DnaK [Spirulina]MDB9495505.1 molecular chaperone DnaK [Spirulina subsalsa CS-330]MDB9502698.1 molecular chaperone DnaK [Spirulina major CS-329]
MGRVVGIDLGTTNSVVAVMEGGKPLVIANAEGMRTTPSVVGFNKDGELVVGQMARRQAVLNPKNTFYALKRFIGRTYGELTTESRRVAYTVRRDENGNVRIPCPRLRQDFAAEELSAKILRKLVEDAERYLGEPVTGAVITVPAYFNDSQRQATRDAGKIAGLDVLRIINEPTAASLAYGLDRQDNQTIMVFDLGGGTFDVSILEVGDGVFEVRATSGDTQLGGNDFDRRIVDWLAERFLEQEGIDLRKSDRQAFQRLTEAAEKAKIELSGVASTEINLPFITATDDGPKHIETTLNRADFEELCGDLLSRIRRPIKRAFKDAGLSPRQIDEIVLVGGSTRMPMVQDLVRMLIDREPNQNVNPDEVVAVGAAVQAGILSGVVKDVLLLDVTPLSLGLESISGAMKKLIPRNTTIPVRRSEIFSTGENNQTVVEVHILQGEREMATDNKSLGRFKLAGIPPAPRGVPQIQVAFDIDANGILQVTAVDKTTGREQSIVVQEASTLNQREVEQMLQEAEQFAQQDRERRERVEKRNRAKALVDQSQRRLREIVLDFGTQFASYYRRQIDALIQDLEAALAKDDERAIDRTYADLQDALYELNREVRMQYEDDDDDDFFGSIKRTFSGDKKNRDPYRPAPYAPPYGAPNNPYDFDDPYGAPPPRRGARSPYDAPAPPPRSPYDAPAPPPPRSAPPYDDPRGSRRPPDRRSNDGRDWNRPTNSRPPSDRSRSRPSYDDWDDDDDDWL